MVNGLYFTWRPGISGVMQESYAGVFPSTALFNICVSDLEEVTRYVFITFTGDTKLVMAAGQVNTIVGRVAIQQDPDRLRAWANKNFIKFNKKSAKCCSREGRAWCRNPGWDCLAWGAALLKRPWGPL